MLYCFDVDETLIRSFLREGDREHDYDDVEILPGRAAKIGKLAQENSTRFAIVTNQGGVAFGYQTPEQVMRKMHTVISLLGMLQVPTTLHCAYEHKDAKIELYRCDLGYRKPGPRMIEQAINRHHGDRQSTIMVGDMPTDEQAAKAARVLYCEAEVFFG